MFISRDKELQEITALINQNKKNALLIYGKRRVGKSTLILKALDICTDNHPDIIILYYECLQTSLEDNLRQMEQKLKKLLHNKFLHFSDFGELFDYLGTLPQKVIVAVDEYSYLKEGVEKQVDSLFQRIIDTMHNNITLILLGSYVSVMKELLEKENPLFGRFSLVMNITSFDYYDSSFFYTDKSVKDKIQHYCVFGGLPFTNTIIDPAASLETNIINHILNPNSPLRIYIENILLMELSKVSPANMILASLSNSKKKYGELEQDLGLKNNGTLDKQLKNLIDMDVIKKIYPINKAGDKRKTFYEISDNIVRFYYKYVYTGRDIIARIGGKNYFQLYIKDSLKTFISYRFEELVREYFIRKTKSGELKNIYDVGTFWYDITKEKKNGEFDCCLAHKDSYSFYEVKYYDKPMVLKDIESEAIKINQVASFIKIETIGFVALSGFETNTDAYNLISADELYDFTKKIKKLTHFT